MDDILFTEIFDEQPPKKDAWKTVAAPQDIPGVQVEDLNYYLGKTSGAGKAIADAIELQDLIEQVAQGIVLGKTTPAPAPAPESPLLADNFFTKNWLESIAIEARRTTPPSPKQMQKFDRGITGIVEQFASKLGTDLDDEHVQNLIDHCSEFVAHQVQRA